MPSFYVIVIFKELSKPWLLLASLLFNTGLINSVETEGKHEPSCPQIILALILDANLLFHSTIMGKEKKNVGKTWCCPHRASCGCFSPGPPIWLYSLLQAPFAPFNNECRANQLPRKCAAAEEANPPLLLFQWPGGFKRTLGKGFAWIHTVRSKEVSSSIVPKQVGFINKYLPATNPPVKSANPTVAHGHKTQRPSKCDAISKRLKAH